MELKEIEKVQKHRDIKKELRKEKTQRYRKGD